MWLPSGKWKLLASPVPEHPNYKPPLKPWLGRYACPAVCAGKGGAHELGQGGVGAAPLGNAEASAVLGGAPNV